MAITDDFLLNRSGSFTLGPSSETRQDLTLTQSAATTGNIRGTVTNAVGGAAIVGATLKLRTSTGNGEPIAHTVSVTAGNYIFPDIPTGTYKINVTKPGFVTSLYTSVTLVSGGTITLNFTLTPESRPLNVVYGIVSNQSTGAPVSGAYCVLVSDSATFANPNISNSNSTGQFILDQISDSTQYLGTAAKGFYLSDFRSITISGATILREDEVLQPYSLPQATVNGFITNQANGLPVANACVGLYSLATDGMETLHQVTFTDSSGFYVFGRAPAGTYVIKAKTEQVVV